VLNMGHCGLCLLGPTGLRRVRRAACAPILFRVACGFASGTLGLLEGTPDAEGPAIQHMRVDHCRCNIAVAQEFLDSS